MFFVWQAKSQLPDYHVRLFDESYGFSSYSPQQIIQDQLDFVWILYRDRVQRFNGKQVKEFLPGERLLGVLCDRQNRLWVVGFHGVYLFINDHEGFKKLAFDTSGDFSMGHIFQLTGKPLWLQTSKGFYELDSSTLNFNKINLPELQVKLPIDIRHFSVFENTIFFSNSDSVFSVDLVNRSRVSLKGKDNYGYYSLSRNQLLLSTWNNISWWYDFANKRITPVKLNDKPKKENGFFLVNGIEKINEKEWLLVSTEGVYRFNIESGLFRKLKLYNKGKPLQNDRSITNLYFDRHQNIWMIYEYGLITFKPNQETIGLIRNFEPDPGKAWNNNVRNFMPDEKGNLWLGTANGFAYWDLNRNSFTAYTSKQGAADQINHPSIRGVYYDGKYVILGPTNGGIWLFDPVTKKYRKPLYENGPEGDTTRSRLQGDFIRQIKPIHNGNYIISAREGIYIMEGKTYKIRRFALPGKNENCIFSYQDSRKRIWIGSSTILHCLDSLMVYQFSVQPGIRNLYSMCELAPDEYLAGGFKGLTHIKISNGKTVVKKVNPFFENVIIASVIKDITGKIWLPSVNNYLYKYDPVNHTVDSFDQASNLQGNEFNYNCFYQSQDGMLFLGGINGINYFYPDKIGREKDSLHVSITKVTVNIDDTGYYHRSGTISLKHFQSSIEVAYISPCYSNSSQLQYRYRLQGVDTGWRSNGNNNSIRFTSLSPGRYIFNLAASVNGTDWFESGEKLFFVISPPFWKTWWFILLLSVTLVTSFYWWIHSLRERLRSEKMLNYFATSLYGQNTVDDIFWDVAKNCMAMLNFEDCVIYQYDEQKKELVQKAAYGSKNPDRHEILNPMKITLGQGIVGSVALSKKPEIVKNTSADKRYIVDDRHRFSEITVPVIVDGELFGIIDSEHTQKNYFRKYHLKLLNKIAEICAAKISRYIVEEKLRAKISRDLHDEMGSTLTSINIISKLVIQQSENNPGIQQQLSKIKEYSSTMMESMSDIVWAINPGNDRFEKLVLRIKEFTAEILEPVRINYYFREDGPLENIKLNLEQRKDIYMIFKEALNNAVKYSNATEINIMLQTGNKQLSMQITDNGNGFDTGKIYSGNGLKNMQSRAEQIKAFMEINSIKNTGTTIRLLIPLT